MSSYSVKLTKYADDNKTVMDEIVIHNYGVLEELLDDLDEVIEQRKWEKNDE